MCSKAGMIFTWVLFAVLLLNVGCTSEKVLHKNTRYYLPGPPHYSDLPKRLQDTGEPYRTDPFEQWIELKEIFENESAAVIIHCKGTIGVVGEWATQTLCWARISGDVSYDSVVIETYDFYSSESGPVFSEQQYWPVDANNDELEDIFVLKWGHGEQGVYDDGPYRRAAYDEPMGIRVIVRKEYKGWPWGIESDTLMSWDDVEKEAGTYRAYLEEAQKVCRDEQWQTRIERAIDLLD